MTAQGQVVNLREVDLTDADVVRIDRLSDWGNPYKIGLDGNRTEVISAYRRWISQRPDLLARLDELRGKRLACWCFPRACHGDVLVELLGSAMGGSPEGGPSAATGKPCARCNSRYGTRTGHELCWNCSRDSGESFDLPTTAAVPVDPLAEGWADLLSPCPACGKPSIYGERPCSYCRGLARARDEDIPGGLSL